MGKVFYRILLFVAMSALALYVNADDGNDDNIVIPAVESVYRLKAGKDGSLERVKVIDKVTYRANKFEEKARAIVGYGGSITIDKAAAPGAKPEYKPAFSDDVFYDDSRVCTMRVPLKPGKDVLAVFERTFTDPSQFCEIRYPAIYDVLDYRLSIIVPQELAEVFKFTTFNYPSDAETQVTQGAKGERIYNYHIKNLKKYKGEANSPEFSYVSPLVVASGYFADVADLYRYFKKFVDHEPENAEITAVAKQVTENLTDPYDKIYAIIRWVHDNIRYVAIEHGEYGTRPESAANVFANRYGDCKGSANLIKAMLKSQGLDGRLVWIGTKDSTPYQWDECPVLGAGNHMIAACVLPDTIVYVDGTASHSPKRYISQDIQDRTAIIEDGDSYILAKVPTLPNDIDCDHFKAEYHLDSDWVLRGEISHVYTGWFAGGYDAAYKGITASRRDKMLHDLASSGRKTVEVTDVEWVRAASDSPDAVLKAKITDTKAVTNTAGRMLLTVKIIDPQSAPIVDLGKRKTPMLFDRAYTQTADVSVTLPEGYEVGQIADVMEDNPWFDCKVHFVADGNVLKAQAYLKNKRMDVPLDEMEQWNVAVRQINKALTLTIKVKTNQ